MIKLAFERPSPNNHIGQVICKVTKQEFCHVEIWLTGPQDAAHCFSAREGSNVSFMNRDLTDKVGWEIVDLNLTPEQEEICLGFCFGAEGKLYNYSGLVAFNLPSHASVGFSLFCSQTASLMLEVSAKRTFPKTPDKISPGDLYNYLKVKNIGVAVGSSMTIDGSVKI